MKRARREGCSVAIRNRLIPLGPCRSQWRGARDRKKGWMVVAGSSYTRGGPRNKSLRHGDEGKTSYVPTLTKSEQTPDPVSTPFSLSLPGTAGSSSGTGGFILHPPQRSSLGIKMRSQKRYIRLAFNQNSCPDRYGKPDRERT